MYAVPLGGMVMVKKQETTARAPHQNSTFISATAGRQLSHALILRAAPSVPASSCHASLELLTPSMKAVTSLF